MGELLGEVQVAAPLLVAVTQQGRRDPARDKHQFHVVVDVAPIQISAGITLAMVTLYCALWAFHVDYPASRVAPFQLLQLMLGLETKPKARRAPKSPRNGDIMPSVSKVYRRLSSVKRSL